MKGMKKLFGNVGSNKKPLYSNSSHNFHTTAPQHDAFAYFGKYSNRIKEDRLEFVHKNFDFCRKINTETIKNLSDVKSMLEIRVFYDPDCIENEEVTKAIPGERIKELVTRKKDYNTTVEITINECLEKEPEEKRGQVHKQLLTAERTVLKGSARNFQEGVPGGTEALKHIHEVEEKNKGDIMGLSHQQILAKTNNIDDHKAMTRRKRKLSDIPRAPKESDAPDQAQNDDTKTFRQR